MERVTAGGRITPRADAYGIPASDVDGNDVLAVREAAEDAVTRAREGEGPTFLECRTYRHKGHSRVDPGKYRPKDEVEAWLARDPLPRLAERLEPGSAERIDEAVEHEIETALEDARAAAFPDPSRLASAAKGA